MKRLLLSLLLLVAVNATMSAYSDFEVDGLCYNFSENGGNNVLFTYNSNNKYNSSY